MHFEYHPNSEIESCHKLTDAAVERITCTIDEYISRLEDEFHERTRRDIYDVMMSGLTAYSSPAYNEPDILSIVDSNTGGHLFDVMLDALYASVLYDVESLCRTLKPVA